MPWQSVVVDSGWNRGDEAKRLGPKAGGHALEPLERGVVARGDWQMPA